MSQWGDAIFGPVLTVSQFYHLAATAQSRVVTLYLNGAAVAQKPMTLNTQTDQFYIGQFGGDTSRSLQGLVDEVSVYNRALSAAEIQAIYGAGRAGKCKPSAGTVAVRVDPGAYQGSWSAGGRSGPGPATVDLPIGRNLVGVGVPGGFYIDV